MKKLLSEQWREEYYTTLDSVLDIETLSFTWKTYNQLNIW